MVVNADISTYKQMRSTPYATSQVALNGHLLLEVYLLERVNSCLSNRQSGIFASLVRNNLNACGDFQ
jgi:hypothetical protein